MRTYITQILLLLGLALPGIGQSKDIESICVPVIFRRGDASVPAHTVIRRRDATGSRDTSVPAHTTIQREDTTGNRDTSVPAPRDTSIPVPVIPPPRNRTLGEVVVTAGSFEASDKAKGASLTPMDAVTVAGSGGDVAASMRALPGTQQVGEREGLYVRGGTGDEAKQFIDGTLLRNPNFASIPGILQPARINPFLFKGILFSTGGYSAQYGQALSSALILESVDLPDQPSASLHIFPSNIGAGFQQLARNGKSSYGLSLDYGNLAPYNKVVPQKQDFFLGPEYLRGEANARIRTGKTGMLKFYVNSSNSNIGMRTPDIDSTSLLSSFLMRNRNVYTNISYKQSLGADWQLNAGAAYSYNRDKIRTELLDSLHAPVHIPSVPYVWKQRDISQPSHFAQGRAVLARFFSRGQALRMGAEYFYTNDRYTSNDSLYTLHDGLLAAFAEGDIRISSNMMARAGVRVEHSVLLRRANVAPRLSFAYRFNDGGQVNLAYGVFYQKPENQYLFRQSALDFMQADHYILNYTRKFNNRLLRVETYYKHYRRLLTTEPDIATNGSGYAKGIELFWRDKKSIRNLDYWVTYTYLDTKRQYLNYPYRLRPDFATPHTASLVAKRYFQDINLSINMAYTFATGRPYYGISTPAAGNKPYVFDRGTTRTYSTLNLSGAYMFSIFKKWKNKDFSGIGFGVNNILGTPLIFGYQYSYDGRHRTPVTLPATRTYYIGIFMSFGIDRSEDFINNNLQ